MATGLRAGASEIWRYFAERQSLAAPDVGGVRGSSTEGEGEGELGSAEEAGGESSRERLAIVTVMRWWDLLALALLQL